MPRKGAAPKRQILPDPIYGSELIQRFINRMMVEGKKVTAEKIFYGAMKTAEDKAGAPALEVFEKALHNVMPTFEVRPRRVGGQTYQVPMEVRPDRWRDRTTPDRPCAACAFSRSRAAGRVGLWARRCARKDLFGGRAPCRARCRKRPRRRIWWDRTWRRRSCSGWGANRRRRGPIFHRRALAEHGPASARAWACGRRRRRANAWRRERC
ncbi:MAG: hypothetical protein HY248_01280, partial [Fimbriimonas ginsengisoli]|nr:hypothetical protein [Fimbriimonas ginsengisoli]